MKDTIRDFLAMAAVAVLVFVGLRFTVQTFVVYGPSMEPNFWEHQRLLINKVVYRIHEPERGDVIVFDPPYERRDSYIKRIIGLPGEYVELRGGKVLVHQADGSMIQLDEPYVKEPAVRSYISGVIPDGEYFVLGDNRNNTNDSRNGWTVPAEDIIGKAWLSIWPPGQWGLAANHPPQERIANAAND
jgi:signal peptidase I